VKKPAEESVDESVEEPPEEIPEQREAPHVAESPEEEAPHVVEVPEEREPSRVSLGVRGFGGVVRQAGEYSPVYGGGVLFGVPLVGRIELEASAMVARKDDDSAFLFAEVIGKWVVETESSLSPHLSFGPVVSFDFTKPVEASGGLLLGGGATYWIIPRVGAILDVNYRLLFGAEVTHVGTAALGVVFRPF
jgi:hypothetical protein